MIKPGDKILVGVSGGKDSLTLINVLHQMSKSYEIPFSVGAATVDP